MFACLENIQVGFPDTLVIIGAGPIGDFMAQLAKIRGAQKVIMIDINDTRLEMAKQFGVDVTINSAKEDPITAVLKLTNGKGADKVISATPANSTQQQSLHMVRKGGLAVFFGGVPKGSLTELDTNLIHYNISVYGAVRVAAQHSPCRTARHAALLRPQRSFQSGQHFRLQRRQRFIVIFRERGRSLFRGELHRHGAELVQRKIRHVFSAGSGLCHFPPGKI